MFVADGRRSPVLGDGHDDDSQIKHVLGTIGDLQDAVDPVVVNLWKFKPFKQQRSGDFGMELLVNGVSGMAGVFDF